MWWETKRHARPLGAGDEALAAGDALLALHKALIAWTVSRFAWSALEHAAGTGIAALTTGALDRLRAGLVDIMRKTTNLPG